MKRPRVHQNRDKFLAFLRSKNAKMVCQVCGAQAWAVAEPGG